MKRILLFLCIIAVFSCQKEPVATTPNTLPVITQNDSTILSMYIDLDTTMAAGQDTVNVHKYFYDNLKRVIKSEHAEYDGANANYYTTIYLTYNASDTLPYKRVEIDLDEQTGEVDVNDTAYYLYSGGKVIYDSTIIANDAYIIKKFTYYGNDIALSERNYNSNGFYNIFGSIRAIKVGGNTTSTTDSIYSNGSIDYYTTYFISYDDKKNPFHNLTETFLDKSTPNYNNDGIYAEDMIYEKNNPVDVSCGLCQEHYSYSYEYNANGYPSVTRYTDQVDPTIFYKRIFIYTKL